MALRPLSGDDFGALAWRPEIEMSWPEFDDFLSGRLVARAATVGSTGFPLGALFASRPGRAPASARPAR